MLSSTRLRQLARKWLPALIVRHFATEMSKATRQFHGSGDKGA
jgi:hypothetical protein